MTGITKEEVIELVSIAVAEFLDRLKEEGAVPAREWWEEKLDKLLETTGFAELLYYCTLPRNWYHVLWVVGEQTEYLRRKGLDLKFTVSPSSTVVYELDLTPTQYCCVCPTFTTSSELGPAWSRLTVLVNEAPVPDILESTWLNVYVCQNLHVPTEGPPLQNGYLYTFAPKRKVKWTFKNLHTSYDNTICFFADYFEMTKDRGYNLIANCYQPFKEKVTERILGKPLKER
jgi:hypothetical protein